MSQFLCPNCRSPLFLEGRSYRCQNGHCFDLSRDGYVNLLRQDHKKTAIPGDNKAMCLARHRFLRAGHYHAMREGMAKALVNALTAQGKNAATVLDAGCGEGYYTEGFFSALEEAGIAPTVVGYDISKYMLPYACKSFHGIDYAVATIFDLPAADRSADAVFNIFTPVAWAEFRRVLKPGGYLFIAGPGPRHLWGLKEALYETPYENVPKRYEAEGFSYAGIENVEDTITVKGREAIESLFLMTPYYWKTSKEATEKLLALPELTTEIAFQVHILQKNS